MPSSRILRFALTFFGFVFIALTLGCAARQPKIPGESDIEVDSVEIVPADPHAALELEHDELLARLGMRKGALTSIEGFYSTFREAEDRRRIEAFWQQFGYFDVDVAAPDVVFVGEPKKARITFKVKENERYKVGRRVFVDPPDDEKELLLSLAPMKEGAEEVDLAAFRESRNVMADKLRREGYGHANVYTRAYVDKKTKTVDWYYFVDAGPRTRIGSIAVDGNSRVPADAIIRRSGLKVGDPYKEGLRDSVVRELLDTGSFAAAFVRVDTDTKYIPPGTLPDTGGELRDDQVDASGHLVPRKLPENVNVTIHVVEAPRVTLRARFARDRSIARRYEPRSDALLPRPLRAHESPRRRGSPRIRLALPDPGRWETFGLLR